jgi:hypothetical protein
MYAPLDSSGQLRAVATRAVDLSSRPETLGATGVPQGFLAAAVTRTTQDELVVVFLACT